MYRPTLYITSKSSSYVTAITSEIPSRSSARNLVLTASAPIFTCNGKRANHQNACASIQTAPGSVVPVTDGQGKSAVRCNVVMSNDSTSPATAMFQVIQPAFIYIVEMNFRPPSLLRFIVPVAFDAARSERILLQRVLRDSPRA